MKIKLIMTLCLMVSITMVYSQNNESQGGKPMISKDTEPNTAQDESAEKHTKPDVERTIKYKDAAFSDIDLEESGELYYIDLDEDGKLVFRPNGDQLDTLFILDDDTNNAVIQTNGVGGFRVEGDGGGDIRYVLNNDGGTHYIFDDASNTNALKVESANEFAINTGGVNERLRIDDEGRMAINRSIANATQLFVESDQWSWSLYGNNSRGTGTTYGVTGVANGGGTGTRYGVWGSASGGDNNWAGYFPTGDTYVGGDLGVGTTDPMAPLHVEGDFRLEDVSPTIDFYNGTDDLGYMRSLSNIIQIVNRQTTATASLQLWTNGGNTKVFEGQQDGDVILTDDGGLCGIGQTNPTAQLQVSATTDAVIIGDSGGGSPGYLNIDMPTGANSYIQRWRENGSSSGYFDSFGSTNVFTVFGSALASGGTWTNSDSKLKTNVATLAKGTLDKVMQLNPTTYDYKTEGEYAFLGLPSSNQIGFIAQELEQVFPEFVQTSEISNDDLQEPVSHDIKSVNYAGMVTVLTKALQEQNELIKALEARVAELEK